MICCRTQNQRNRRGAYGNPQEINITEVNSKDIKLHWNHTLSKLFSIRGFGLNIRVKHYYIVKITFHQRLSGQNNQWAIVSGLPETCHWLTDRRTNVVAQDLHIRRPCVKWMNAESWIGLFEDAQRQIGWHIWATWWSVCGEPDRKDWSFPSDHLWACASNRLLQEIDFSCFLGRLH